MRVILLLAAISFACAADPAKSGDPWNKVKELKSGSTVRIYHHGKSQPLTAAMVEATDDKIVYVMKNSQTYIDRKDVDRIEYRPSATSEKTETHTVNPDGTDSYGQGHSWSRSGWQTVYQKR